MKRPVRNITAIVLGDAGTRLFGFLVTVYLARVLGPEPFGLIGIGLALLGQLSFLTVPGMNVLEVRNVAAAGEIDPVRLGGVLLVRALLATIVCAVTWFVLTLWSVASAGGTVSLLFVVALLPMSLFLDWFFQGKEEMWPVSVSRVLHYGLYAAGVLVWVRTPSDLVFAPVAYLIGSWAAAIFLQILFRLRFGPLNFRVQPAYLVRILKENMPVGAAMLLGQSTVNLPPLVLGAITGAAAVGTLTAALKLALVFLAFDRLLNTLLLPSITRYLSGQGGEPALFVRVVLKIVLVTVLPLVIAGIILSPHLVGIVYGPGYADSVRQLQILMGYVGLTILNSVFVSLLVGSGKTKEYLAVSTIGAVFLLILLGILVPPLGAVGAALSVCLSELVLTILTARAASTIGVLPGVPQLWKPVCAGLIMVTVAALLLGVGSIVAVAGSLSVYLITLVLARAFEPGEIAFVRERLL
jgi:O-antigen/teichoic acid export membrane protein